MFHRFTFSGMVRFGGFVVVFCWVGFLLSHKPANMRVRLLAACSTPNDFSGFFL